MMERSRWAMPFLCGAMFFNSFSGSAAPASFAITPATFSAGQTVEFAIQSDRPIQFVAIEPGGTQPEREISLDGTIADIKIDGRWLIVLRADGTLQRYDMDKKNGSWIPLSTEKSVSAISGFSIHGTRLVTGTADGSVAVYVRSEKGEYRTERRLKLEAALAELALDDTTVVALDHRGEITALDVASGATDHIVTKSPATHIAISGSYIIAATGQWCVLFARQPSGRWQEQSRYSVGPPVAALAANEDRIFATQEDRGLLILGISPEGLLHWVGSHSQLGRATDVANDADKLAVYDNTGNLFVVDVKNSAQPTVVKALKHAGPFSIGEQRLATVADQRVRLWNLEHASPILSNENLNAGEGINYGGQRKGFLDAKESRLYVADWFSGLHIYDVSTPSNPRLLSTFHTPGSAKGVIVRDGIAYVADDDQGLRVVDVKDPKRPKDLGQVQTEGLAYTPIIDGNRLYLASHRGGFQIMDIGNATKPRIIGEFDTPNKAWSVAVKGNILFVADSETGLLVFDVSNPADPRQIGQYDPTGNAEDVVIEGDLAYVAFFELGVHVVDIHDPSQPTLVATLATPGNARGLRKEGNLLFVADWLAGIHAVDVSSPRLPRLVGSFDTPGAAWGLINLGNTIFVFDWWGGLHILDATQPDHIRLVGQYNQREVINDLAVAGQYLYTAEGTHGLQIYDIKNPLNPTWFTGIDELTNATYVAAHGKLACVAYGDRRVAQVDISDPFAPRVTGSWQTNQPLRQLVATERHCLMNVGTELLALDADNPAPKSVRWPFPGTADNFARYGGDSLAVVTGNQLYVLHESEAGLATVAQAPLPASVRSIVGAEDVISVVTENRHMLFWQVQGQSLNPVADKALEQVGLTHTANRSRSITTLAGGTIIDYARLATGHVVLNSVYTPTIPHTKLTLTEQGVLYGAGGVGPYAQRLLQLPELITTSPGRPKIMVPDKLPEGSYNIRVAWTDDSSQVFPDALEVKALRFSKPKITPEEFKKLLEQKRREQSRSNPP